MDIFRTILLPSTPGAFRLWLALVVVIHHATRIEIGKAPVLVFFALSGFWVHKVWLSRYAQTQGPWLTFIVSRWWRIVPVMVLATGMSLTVMAALGDPAVRVLLEMPLRQLFSTLFLLGYAEMPVRPVGPAWSLDIEMQFYLLAPALVILVRRSSALIALGLAYALHVAGMAFYPGVVLTSFLPFFVVGMVAAQHDWRVPVPLANGALAAAVTLTIAIQLSPWQPLLLGENAAWWPSLNLLLAALALPQALVSVTSRGGKHDSVCADQSYIVYMLHWPAILVWRGVEPVTTFQSGALFVVLCLAVALLSWLTRWLLDRPLNHARARWVEARRPVSDRTETLPSGSKGDDSTRVFA